MDSSTSWAEAFKELTVLPGLAQEEFGGENFLRAARFRLEGRALFEETIVPFMEAGGPGRAYDVVMGFVDREVGRSAGIPNCEMHAGFGAAVLCERGGEEYFFLGLANFTTEGLPPAEGAPI
jgi:hypothetical protein